MCFVSRPLWLATAVGLLISLGCQPSRPRHIATKITASPPESENATIPAEPPAKSDAFLQDVEKIRKLLAEEKLDQAAQSLAALAASTELTSEQKETLAELEQALKIEDDRKNPMIKERIDRARTQMDSRQFDAALKLVAELKDQELSVMQQAELDELAEQLQQRHDQYQRLNQAAQQLVSQDETTRTTAKQQLWSHAKATAPVLLDALSENNPQLVAAAIDMLYRMRSPQLAARLVEVLSRPDQARCWPTVVEAFQKYPLPEAAEGLLQLATSSDSAPQRQAALKALAAVPQLPEETFLKLLPLLYAEDPSPSAFLAAGQAAWQHKHHDFMTLRTFSPDLSAQQKERLRRLPEHIDKLTRSQNKPLAQAAGRLAAAALLKTPPALQGVQVMAVSGEQDKYPATGLLDGKWRDTEGPTQWVHQSSGPAWVVLDLGEERTVAGLKIWNFFGKEYETRRGFKDIEIMVTNDPAANETPIKAIVPRAPQEKDEPGDFGWVIRLPFLRGRYVILRGLSTHDGRQQGGLSELQVLGF